MSFGSYFSAVTDKTEDNSLFQQAERVLSARTKGAECPVVIPTSHDLSRRIVSLSTFPQSTMTEVAYPAAELAVDGVVKSLKVEALSRYGEYLTHCGADPTRDSTYKTEVSTLERAIDIAAAHHSMYSRQGVAATTSMVSCMRSRLSSSTAAPVELQPVQRAKRGRDEEEETTVLSPQVVQTSPKQPVVHVPKPVSPRAEKDTLPFSRANVVPWSRISLPDADTTSISYEGCCTRGRSDDTCPPSAKRPHVQVVEQVVNPNPLTVVVPTATTGLGHLVTSSESELAACPAVAVNPSLVTTAPGVETVATEDAALTTTTETETVETVDTVMTDVADVPAQVESEMVDAAPIVTEAASETPAEPVVAPTIPTVTESETVSDSDAKPVEAQSETSAAPTEMAVDSTQAEAVEIEVPVVEPVVEAEAEAVATSTTNETKEPTTEEAEKVVPVVVNESEQQETVQDAVVVTAPTADEPASK